MTKPASSKLSELPHPAFEILWGENSVKMELSNQFEAVPMKCRFALESPVLQDFLFGVRGRRETGSILAVSLVALLLHDGLIART